MPAPAKSFTVIADTAVDVDSPLDEALVTALRDNTFHLEEWLGKNYTAAVDHDHDGVNSKQIPSIKHGEWLQTITGSAVSSIDTTAIFTSAYQRYIIDVTDITGSGAFIMYMRVGTGSGPTFQTGASDYKYSLSGSDSVNAAWVQGSQGQNTFVLSHTDGVKSSTPWSGIIEIVNPSGSSVEKNISGHSISYQGNTAGFPHAGLIFGGRYTATTAITGLRFWPSAGTISGSISVYGRKT